MMSLLSDRLDYEAQAVMRAIKGLGTDEATLITILCTLEEEDIMPLHQAFAIRTVDGTSRALETSGKFKRVLLLAGCDGVGESYAKVINSAISAWARTPRRSSLDGDRRRAVGRHCEAYRDFIRRISSAPSVPSGR